MILSGLLLLVSEVQAQNELHGFLKPADSLNIKRRNTIVISEAAFGAVAYTGLSSIWYDDYAKSDFHFINDNSEWLQMDKAGHVFTSYHLSRFGSELYAWSGLSQQKSSIYGAVTGFVAISAVEVFDGFSAQWGASWGDIAANAGGSLVFISQELLWNEQRITPKFSFHKTAYPSARPKVLGETATEQVFKDYNGQTYWLSANVHSFFKQSKIPKWLSIAAGYGAEGMITANDRLVNTVFFPQKERTRQYYLSVDVDLTRINTKSHLLKTLFSIFNTIKVPAPALEINEKGVTKFHFLYF